MGLEDLWNMPFEAIVRVVENFPWFGAAQRILCERMILMGGRELARNMYADAALQVASRRKIVAILRPDAFLETNRTFRDYAFRGVSNSRSEIVVKEAVEPVTYVQNTEPAPLEGGVNKNYRGAGDYFSREQYEQVKKATSDERRVHTETVVGADKFNLDKDVSLDGFCTEALAEIYAEQGYFERAKEIYAKLILAEPEKSTYFTSLIEKLSACTNAR